MGFLLDSLELTMESYHATNFGVFYDCRPNAVYLVEFIGNLEIIHNGALSQIIVINEIFVEYLAGKHLVFELSFILIRLLWEIVFWFRYIFLKNALEVYTPPYGIISCAINDFCLVNLPIVDKELNVGIDFGEPISFLLHLYLYIRYKQWIDVLRNLYAWNDQNILLHILALILFLSWWLAACIFLLQVKNNLTKFQYVCSDGDHCFVDSFLGRQQWGFV